MTSLEQLLEKLSNMLQGGYINVNINYKCCEYFKSKFLSINFN